MKKLNGNSVFSIIIISFVVLFFLGLFIWQIERYLAVTKDAKVQAQVSKMGLLIDIDNLEQSTESRFAYLHGNKDVAVPLVFGARETHNFKATSTLSRLFLQNRFSATSAAKDSCYIYMYFSPGTAKKQFETYKSNDPGFVVAGWTPFESEVVAAGTPVLLEAVTETLNKEDFYCDKESLQESIPAKKQNGELVDVPGINFQFSGFYYSKVMVSDF